MTPETVNNHVKKQVAAIEDNGRRAALQACLIAPTRHMRTWFYGSGEFECWAVAQDSSRRLLIVYCESGFVDPWGCVEADSIDLGLDAQWFSSLEDAFIYGVWRGPLPPGYEVS